MGAVRGESRPREVGGSRMKLFKIIWNELDSDFKKYLAALVNENVDIEMRFSGRLQIYSGANE